MSGNQLIENLEFEKIFVSKNDTFTWKISKIHSNCFEVIKLYPHVRIKYMSKCDVIEWLDDLLTDDVKVDLL